MIALLLACGAGPPPAPGASLSLGTHAERGELLEDCAVTLLTRAGGDPNVHGQPCGPALRWEGLEPGDYRVLVQGRSVRTHSELVHIERDQHLDLGLLPLEPGGVLSVEVHLPVELEAEGGDLGGILLRVDGEVVGRTDPEGRALLRGVPPGALEVIAQGPAGAAQAVVEVTEGLESEVLLELEPLPQRPVVGLRVTPVPEGAAIRYVHPSGPAAGRLMTGDVLTAVEGQPLAGLSEAEIGPLLAGDEVGAVRHFELLRGGERLSLSVVAAGLGALSEDAPLKSGER